MSYENLPQAKLMTLKPKLKFPRKWGGKTVDALKKDALERIEIAQAHIMLGAGSPPYYKEKIAREKRLIKILEDWLL